MTTTPTLDPVHAERAWRGFDRITLADQTPSPALGWDQSDFRTECGTGCCLAGHVALDNGGVWLVEIRKDGMFIDGAPISGDHDLAMNIWQYMLAEPDDPESAVEETHGKRVIHVSYRAERLLGLFGVSHDLFYSYNTRAGLERLITEHIGPRPTHVDGTAN
jgi:hypothetical protein